MDAERKELVVDDYYTEQTDEDGKVTYVQVEKVEISDEDLFADPRVQKVVDSDIKRRKKVRELNKQIRDLDIEDPPPKDTEVVEEEEKISPAPVMTQEELIAAAIAAIDERTATKEVVRQERMTVLNELMTKHQLKKEALPLLEQSTDPAAAAELLGRSGLKFDEDTGGDPTDQGSDLGVILTGVYKRLGLEADPS